MAALGLLFGGILSVAFEGSEQEDPQMQLPTNYLDASE